MRSSAFSRVGSATRTRLVPGCDLLADFDRHLLEHAGHAGADAQLIDLLTAQVAGSSGADRRSACADCSCARALASDTFRRSVSIASRVASDSARTTDCLQNQVRDEAVLGEALVHFAFGLRVLVVGLDDRGLRALIQRCRRRAGPSSCCSRLRLARSCCSASLSACCTLRVAQLEDDGVGRDLDAGTQDDLLDAALRRRGHPAARFVHRAPACRGRAPGAPSGRA